MADTKTCIFCGGKAGAFNTGRKTAKGERICFDCFEKAFNASKQGLIHPVFKDIPDDEMVELCEFLLDPDKSSPFLSSGSPCSVAVNEFLEYRRVGCVALNDKSETLFIATGMLPSGTVPLSVSSSRTKKLNGYNFPQGRFSGTWISSRSKTYSYKDISDFELIEDDVSLASGGLARAAVGGVLFGGAGAIVGAVTGTNTAKGACRSLRVKIGLLGEDSGVEYIDIITVRTEKKDRLYEDALKCGHEILLGLQSACDYVKQHKKEEPISVAAPFSEADEILKFKNLLDMGVITQEEFDAKKKQLLGINVAVVKQKANSTHIHVPVTYEVDDDDGLTKEVFECPKCGDMWFLCEPGAKTAECGNDECGCKVYLDR